MIVLSISLEWTILSPGFIHGIPEDEPEAGIWKGEKPVELRESSDVKAFVVRWSSFGTNRKVIVQTACPRVIFRTAIGIHNP